MTKEYDAVARVYSLALNVVLDPCTLWCIQLGSESGSKYPFAIASEKRNVEQAFFGMKVYTEFEGNT